MIASEQQNNTKAFVCFSSIIKQQTVKARSLGIKCVLARHKLSSDNVSSTKLYKQWIPCLPVVMKKIYNSFEKSELPKFILTVKTSWIIVFGGFRVEMRNLQTLDIRLTLF